MAEIHLPTDFLMTYEFKQLKARLGGEAFAAAASLRLFTELASLARSNNSPGRIDAGVELDLCQGEWMNGGKGINVVGVMKEKPMPLLVELPDGGWVCGMFAKVNAHLAGNFMSQSSKGGLIGAVKRRDARIQKEAVQQAVLLPAEKFVDSAGRALSAEETERVMVLIKTIDGILKVQYRKNGEFTAGLIAAAAAVVTRYEQPVITRFHRWLAVNRDHPAVERETGRLLEKFEGILALT